MELICVMWLVAVFTGRGRCGASEAVGCGILPKLLHLLF